MHIVDNIKFIIGIVFLIVGLGVLIQARGIRGFGQRKQAGALLIVVAAIFVALGLGVDIKGMIGR
jgi:hypothetical protein